MHNKIPCLAIADPSLVDARGHHFTLTQQITRGAQQLGLKVIWFTHQDFSIENVIDEVSVYPIFTATMYDRYKPEKKGTLPPDLELRLLNELNEGIARADLNTKDHIYFHTGFGDLYRALPGYLSISNGEDKPFLHICTPYDLDTMPGKDPGSVLLELFNTIRTMPAVDKKVFFWAETPQLAQHYTLTYGFNVRAMPLPPPHTSVVEGTRKNSDAVTALYLGAAREEKGFLYLPQLAERLYEPYGKSGKLRFVLQCTPQIIGYLPSIKAAIEKLSGFPPGYVTLIDKILDETEYQAHLTASDLVLLLYSKKGYRIRGSGIAVETVCADKCILTHRGTFCASLITHGGGSAVDDLDEAVAKLSELIERKSEYIDKAKLQGQVYRKTYSVEKYVARMIKQTNSRLHVPFFPSSIIGHVSSSLLKAT
jgi:glycosyltransferase involved in cell wall biosynthesis